MLTRYIQEAMNLATYKILDEGAYYGNIPGFRGVIASAETLEKCRQQLQEVLEEWLLLGIKLGHELPEVNGVRLVVQEA